MKSRPAAAFVLSRPLPVADVPPDGTVVRIAASEAERAALARDLGIPAVRRLEAEIEVRPWARTGFRMTGQVSADIVQDCVVTLEPVEETVDEPIDLRLAPAAEAHKYAVPEADEAGEGEEPPDFFDGLTLDPGAVAEEHFVLGIDPYPRKPGVAFDPAGLVPEQAPAAPATVSPFAALAKLRRE